MRGMAAQSLHGQGGAVLLSSVPNLKVWHDGDTLGADGSLISTWTDKTGNGYDATQTGSARPVVRANALNGRSVVECDGSATYLVRASNPLVGATGGTLFFVAKANADPAANGVAPSSAGPPVGSMGTQGNLGNHIPYSDGNIYDGFGSNSRKTVGNPTPSLTSWRIYAVVSAANDWRFYLEGGAPLFSTTSNTVAWQTAAYAGEIGRSRTSNAIDLHFYAGRIAAVAMFDAALNLTNLNAAGAILATEFALTWTTAT
jgi:hypothetical protein